MIVDLNEFANQSSLECELCIVGSGAAGLSLVREFLGSDLRVMMLEGGGEALEQSSQDLYQCSCTGLPFNGAQSGRFRVYGGSTTKWGGQALPLSPLDFAYRPWVRHSGWPIGYDAFHPFYTRASEFLQIDHFDYRAELSSVLGAAPPDLDRRDIDYHFSKWSPTPDIRQLYTRKLRSARNITLVLHANATKLILTDSLNSLRFIRVQSLQGNVVNIVARYYVLCCGGLENARLLLANSEQKPAGIGNDHDLVGRFLQDHPAARVGTLATLDQDRIQRVFNLFHHKGHKYSVRCSASEELQRRTQILSVSASVMFEVGADSPYTLLREAYHKVRRREIDLELVHTLAMCAARGRELTRPIYEYYVRHRTFTPGAQLAIIINSEQEPNSSSRVTLGTEHDALGLPRLRIHWQVTDLSYRTIRVFSALLRDQFKSAGLGDIVLEPWVLQGGDDWRVHVSDQNHHIGTTRMHDCPSGGVVDTDCRVHGIANLFIAGSSVFPTGGHSNPTLTLIALCIRMADTIKDLVARRAAA